MSQIKRGKTVYISSPMDGSMPYISFRLDFTYRLVHAGVYVENSDERIEIDIDIKKREMKIEHKVYQYNGFGGYQSKQSFYETNEVERPKQWEKKWLDDLDYYYSKYKDKKYGGELTEEEQPLARKMLKELIDSLMPKNEDDGEYFDDGTKFVRRVFEFIKKLLDELNLEEVSGR